MTLHLWVQNTKKFNIKKLVLIHLKKNDLHHISACPKQYGAMLWHTLFYELKKNIL